MKKIITAWRTLISDIRGLAATELALCSPFIIVLMISGYEMSRFILLHQKVDKVAYTISDVVTQNNSVTQAQLNVFMTAGKEIMKPFGFGSSGVIIITSVYKDVGANPTVSWRYTSSGSNGSLARTSTIGNIGATATLPAGLTLNDRDNLIITEVYYSYTPVFTGIYSYFSGSRDIYKVAYYKPRLGVLTSAPT